MLKFPERLSKEEPGVGKRAPLGQALLTFYVNVSNKKVDWCDFCFPQGVFLDSGSRVRPPARLE
jgi:hypothetical protein